MYEDDDSPLIVLADQITALELLWPLPLLLIGIAGILNPIAVGVAIFLALLPWLARWAIFNHLTRPAFLTLPLILFLISGFFGVWASYQPSLSWPLMLTVLGSISLFYALVNATVPPRWLISVVIGVATLLALYFILQYGHFFYPDESGRLHELGKLTSHVMPNLAFFSPYINGVAAFLSGAFLLALVMTWQYRDDGPIVWAIPVLIMAYALLITSSRGAWAALITVISFWIFLTFSQQRRAIMIAIGGLGLTGLIGLIIATMLFPNWLASFQNTADSRLNLYRNSLYLLGDYPFTGIGLGDTFALAYSRYQLLIQVPFLTHSHNLFLSVGLGQGLIGVVSLIWLIITFYYLVIRVERVGLSERPLLLFRGAWLGVTATFLHGLVDAPQFSAARWTMPMLFILMGLTIDIGRPALLWADDNQDEDAPSSPKKSSINLRPMLLPMIGLLIVIGVGLFYYKPLLGSWYANLGSVYHTQADLLENMADSQKAALKQQAMAYFKQAIETQADQVVAHRRLGLIALLDNEAYEEAIKHLEIAYNQEPQNQATLKGLGLAYTWAGQIDQAARLFNQLDSPEEIAEELSNWRNWMKNQGHETLANNAKAVIPLIDTSE